MFRKHSLYWHGLPRPSRVAVLIIGVAQLLYSVIHNTFSVLVLLQNYNVHQDGVVKSLIVRVVTDKMHPQYFWGVWIRWSGTVEWNGGMEYWNICPRCTGLRMRK